MTPIEGQNADHGPMLNHFPFKMNAGRKMITCPRGSTYLEMVEAKTEENKNEDRMKKVDRGISTVSYLFKSESLKINQK